jgi:hypothetical protein
VLGELVGLVTGEPVPSDAEAVLRALAAECAPFAGLDFGTLGGEGRVVVPPGERPT